jgi:hypothetical protein
MFPFYAKSQFMYSYLDSDDQKSTLADQRAAEAMRLFGRPKTPTRSTLNFIDDVEHFRKPVPKNANSRKRTLSTADRFICSSS